MKKILIIIILISFIPITTKNSLGSVTAPESYDIENAYPKITFNSPMDLQDPRNGSGRLMIVEQQGIIKSIENNSSVNQTSVFLDISSKVLCCGEQGLLGMALHPNFNTNGYFYVDYTASSPKRTVIARYQVESINYHIANAGSELIIIEIDQPYSNHNAGQILFDKNGYLLIPLGDGGSGGDPFGHGQNRSTFLGSVLRIDVDNPANGKNYSIPSDNPFIGNIQNYKEEIFAYGLRNPWRMSIDRETGQIWTGDVGQGKYEEVDIIEKGKNYGWNTMEGVHCYLPASGCNQEGLELPIYEYSHGVDGIAIVGGYVYRGTNLSSLYGKYIYGDYSSGRVWALDYDGVNPTKNDLLFDADFQISSFGEDLNGELYILSLNGNIYNITFEESETTDDPGVTSISGFTFHLIFILLSLSIIVNRNKNTKNQKK